MPAQKTDKSAKLTPLQKRRKIALLEAGVTTADVARAAKVTRQTAWEVLMGKCTSARVQQHFAKLTNKPIDKLFPPNAAA